MSCFWHCEHEAFCLHMCRIVSIKHQQTNKSTPRTGAAGMYTSQTTPPRRWPFCNDAEQHELSTPSRMLPETGQLSDAAAVLRATVGHVPNPPEERYVTRFDKNTSSPGPGVQCGAMATSGGLAFTLVVLAGLLGATRGKWRRLNRSIVLLSFRFI